MIVPVIGVLGALMSNLVVIVVVNCTTGKTLLGVSHSNCMADKTLSGVSYSNFCLSARATLSGATHFCLSAITLSGGPYSSVIVWSVLD